jgi:dephospho-CoA kinase
VMIVYAPKGLRRRRALERGMSGGDVDARMAAQPSDAEMLRAADIVMDNHGTVEELLERVRRFDRWARSA